MEAIVNYADKYQKAVQQGFYDGHLFTSDLWLSPSNKLIDFDGAKHIKVPRLTTLEGRKDRRIETEAKLEKLNLKFNDLKAKYDILKAKYNEPKKHPSKNKVVNTINGLVDTIQQLTIGFVRLEETTDLTGEQKMNKVIEMVKQTLEKQGIKVSGYVVLMIEAFAEQEVAKIKKENK